MQLFTAQQYLKIDLYNNHQGDKAEWDDRIAWVDSVEHMLEDLVPTADEPALFYAGVQAYRAMQRGEAIGYPISLDGVASGMQILSALINCEKSARHCGLIDTGRREDPYVNLYQFMCDELGEHGQIDRAKTKKAIMTSLYRSTAIPRQVFGDGTLLDLFYKTMETEVPGAWELNEALAGLWQADAYSHDWTLPDNFHVKVKVMDKAISYVQFLNMPYQVEQNVNQPTKEGRSLPANVTHSVDGFVVREMVARCMYDPAIIDGVRAAVGSKGDRADRPKDKMLLTLWNHYLKSGFLSVRVLQYIDVKNVNLIDQEVLVDLLKSLPKKPFKVLTIHDCFRVHPNYGNDLRIQYNTVLSLIAKSDMLSFIATQITGTPMPVNKMGSIHEQILNANYALS